MCANYLVFSWFYTNKYGVAAVRLNFCLLCATLYMCNVRMFIANVITPFYCRLVCFDIDFVAVHLQKHRKWTANTQRLPKSVLSLWMTLAPCVTVRITIYHLVYNIHFPTSITRSFKWNFFSSFACPSFDLIRSVVLSFCAHAHICDTFLPWFVSIWFNFFFRRKRFWRCFLIENAILLLSILLLVTVLFLFLFLLSVSYFQLYSQYLFGTIGRKTWCKRWADVSITCEYSYDFMWFVLFLAFEQFGTIRMKVNGTYVARQHMKHLRYCWDGSMLWSWSRFKIFLLFLSMLYRIKY